MYPILLFSAFLINFVFCNELNHIDKSEVKDADSDKNNVMGIPNWKQHFWKPHKKKIMHNASFIEKSENMIRLPTIKPFEEKKKKIMKSPKRTIQKIIKKKKQKTKRLYVVKLQKKMTTTSQRYDKPNVDISAWQDEMTTSATNVRRKPKKYNSKLTRNPMPFQKLKKKFTKRDKRHAFDREDVYILKDFDELKFLKDNKDVSVVQTHVQKYW